jgi:molybdenum cofactor guanylyltransferase
MIPLTSITALILAGGRGSRMGGLDKGLQHFRGTPLALHALMRLQMQQGGPLADTMINANRNLSAYESFGTPVWPDSIEGFAGPLAGFLTGLERCETPWLLTVPCDTPLFPLDLASRMASALDGIELDIVMASAPERDPDGKITLRAQPVFCLLRASVLEQLAVFVSGGGRKIDDWTGRMRSALVPFDAPEDDPRAFMNANTLAELQALEAPN